MKKFLLFFVSACLLMVNSSSAVLITSTDNFDGTCTVEMSCETGEKNMQAFGLSVYVHSTLKITGVEYISSSPSTVLMIDIIDHDSGPGYVIGDPPVGPPGASLFPLNNFTIICGALGTPGEPIPEGISQISFLFKADRNIYGTIKEDMLRGGVFSVDGHSLDINPEALDFTITVPEPCTVLLFGFGGLIFARRRR